MGGSNNFLRHYAWVKGINPETSQVALAGVTEFLLESHVDWPDFEQRLIEMNHKNPDGSRSGDIVVMLNGTDGYLAINCGEDDEQNGWHGGPTRAESEVPLMYRIPGPGVLPESQLLIDQAYGLPIRNWQLGAALKDMIMQFRQ